jgi:uncharacterized protein
MLHLWRKLGPIILALGLAAAPPARADELDQAKASGVVGERIDGYLGVVRKASAAVRDLVTETNRERRKRYAEVAKKRDVPIEAVAQIAGKKLIEKASDGEYVMATDGKWRKK